MIIHGLVQGGIDMVSRRSVCEYPYLLQWLPLVPRPGACSCLVIGLGADVVPMWFQARGVATDIVDIDPAVVDIARRWFGFDPRGKAHVDDARCFLSRPGRRYDVVITTSSAATRRRVTCSASRRCGRRGHG